MAATGKLFGSFVCAELGKKRGDVGTKKARKGEREANIGVCAPYWLLKSPPTPRNVTLGEEFTKEVHAGGFFAGQRSESPINGQVATGGRELVPKLNEQDKCSFR